MKGDNYTNKLPSLKYISAFERETYIWRIYSGIALNGAAPCIYHHLAHTDFRHNIRKQFWLPPCAITQTLGVKVEEVPITKVCHLRSDPQKYHFYLLWFQLSWMHEFVAKAETHDRNKNMTTPADCHSFKPCLDIESRGERDKQGFLFFSLHKLPIRKKITN